MTIKDTLEGDNMYTCSHCGKKVRAEKRSAHSPLKGHRICLGVRGVHIVCRWLDLEVSQMLPKGCRRAQSRHPFRTQFASTVCELMCQTQWTPLVIYNRSPSLILTFDF